MNSLRTRITTYERDRYEKLLLEATNLAREITDVFYRDAALHQLIKPLTAAGDEIQAKSCFRLLRWILFKTQSLRNTPVWALDFDCVGASHRDSITARTGTDSGRHHVIAPSQARQRHGSARAASRHRVDATSVERTDDQRYVASSAPPSRQRQGRSRGRTESRQRRATDPAGYPSPAHRQPRGAICRAIGHGPDHTSRVAGSPDRSPNRHNYARRFSAKSDTTISVQRVICLNPGKPFSSCCKSLFGVTTKILQGR